jgi:tripartite-type tricarboxylate transporter receptor subunit TctC
VPTTSEAGLKGFELEAWVGIFAPAGTPADVISKLSASIKQAMEMPDTKTRSTAAGIEIRYQPPEALDALVKRETEFWAKTIKSAGITAD